jgi:hypothetical protein
MHALWLNFSQAHPASPTLPAKGRVEGLLEVLRHAAERGRDQLHLPPTAQGRDARKLVNATPAGFMFACKAHTRITHINRLKESEFTEVFFEWAYN